MQTVVFYCEYRLTHYWKPRLADIEREAALHALAHGFWYVGTQSRQMMAMAEKDRDQEFRAFRMCCYRIATVEYYRVVEAAREHKKPKWDDNTYPVIGFDLPKDGKYEEWTKASWSEQKNFWDYTWVGRAINCLAPCGA